MKEKLYAHLAKIPKGTVVTYGQLASMLGSKRLSRAVGNWLHQNTDPDSVPCYRVVNSRGELSDAYAFGGIKAQAYRLEQEGIEVRNGKVDLKKYQYKMPAD